MANEELKEQIDLKKELLNLTKKATEVDADASIKYLDQIKFLSQAIQAGNDNNKLKIPLKKKKKDYKEQKI